MCLDSGLFGISHRGILGDLHIGNPVFNQQNDLLVLVLLKLKEKGDCMPSIWYYSTLVTFRNFFFFFCHGVCTGTAYLRRNKVHVNFEKMFCAVMISATLYWEDGSHLQVLG